MGKESIYWGLDGVHRAAIVADKFGRLHKSAAMIEPVMRSIMVTGASEQPVGGFALPTSGEYCYGQDLNTNEDLIIDLSDDYYGWAIAEFFGLDLTNGLDYHATVRAPFSRVGGVCSVGDSYYVKYVGEDAGVPMCALKLQSSTSVGGYVKGTSGDIHWTVKITPHFIPITE